MSKYPEVRLAIEFQPTGTPRPTSIGVFFGRDLVAIVSLEQFDECSAKLAAMRAARAETFKAE